ncbi:MAG: stage II sporulation protein P [Oscillospiraceae bacterium]|nr:stage II sporulation protein P [Oscillospiraceae bacterium]
MDPIRYRKKKWAGLAGLILFVLLLWLICSPAARARVWAGTKAVLGSPALLRGVVYLETGLRMERETAPEPAERVASTGTANALPRRNEQRPSNHGQAGTEDADRQCLSLQPETERSENPEPPQTMPGIEPFTAEEAEAILFRGNCSYEVDKAELLLRPLDWPDEPGPKVLIIHSHSCESYTQCEGHSYIPSANYRTLDMNNNVVAVGDALARELAGLGVELIHDRTYNDYPDYNSSYAVAREKIQDYLEQYPSIVMVLDLHRDALEQPVRETVELEGQTIAPLMLVIGTDEGGLNHPNWADNLSCGLKLQALANRESPGLFKRISFRKQRFNGDLTRGSLIVEVGSTENTLPEAEAAMPYLAEYVAELLECS